MSELKDYSILDIEAIDDERLKKKSAPGKWVPESRVYLKSEADKVIAEKDAEIAELQEQVHEYALGSYVMQARAEKEARHSKYKLCLAMANLCHWKSAVFIYKKDKNDFYWRWYKRWLKIAEKFKEEA